MRARGDDRQLDPAKTPSLKDWWVCGVDWHGLITTPLPRAGHHIFHVARGLHPQSCAVAVVGAAHVQGIEQLFRAYSAQEEQLQAQICSAHHCGRQDEILELYKPADLTPVFHLACGYLAVSSAVSLTCRYGAMRWLKRSYNGRYAHWCSRMNFATVAAGTSSIALTAYTLKQSYNSVRMLQLRCRERW